MTPFMKPALAARLSYSQVLAKKQEALDPPVAEIKGRRKDGLVLQPLFSTRRLTLSASGAARYLQRWSSLP
jgi:hypothetical protein